MAATDLLLGNGIDWSEEKGKGRDWNGVQRSGTVGIYISAPMSDCCSFCWDGDGGQRTGGERSGWEMSGEIGMG